MNIEYLCVECGMTLPNEEIELEAHSLVHTHDALVEFGNKVVNVLNTADPDECGQAINKVTKNYMKVKAKAFPTWRGAWELIAENCPHCGKHVTYGWYAQVPKSYLTPDYQERAR